MDQDGLTPRETEVLELLAAAKTNSKLATTLGISIRTVEGHVCMIFRKKRVKNRMEAARIWWEHENGMDG